jgi:N-acetylneuraminic acid mutarotase
MRRGSRLVLVLPLIAFGAAIAALLGAGSGSSSHSSSRSSASVRQASSSRSGSRSGRRAGAGAQLAFAAAPHVRVLAAGTLPAAVEDTAVAPAGPGGLALLGGIDAAQSSVDTVTLLDNGTARAGGTLPEPQHDAQAARLGADVYVFGGGVVSSYDHILRYDPTSGLVSAAGTLPSPASDVAVASLNGTAYVVGGYDGVQPLDTILAWRPGQAPRVVARLPAGLRYAAVAAVGDRLIIAGGTEGSGETVSDAIFTFEPSTGALKQIGRLPVALTHASAATLDGQVLVIGGRRELSGEQSDAILAIDPSSGRVRTAGRLPTPLSDAAVASLGDKIVVAGGESPAGVQSQVVTLTAAVS